MAHKYRSTALIILAFIFSLLISCSPRTEVHWYKGNLHTHTTFSDGDTETTEVIGWYKDNGYNFLAITDHNITTKAGTYTDLSDSNFILISGNEISDTSENKPVHLLALGLSDIPLERQGGDTVLNALQNNVDAIRRAGALPVMAHPNFGWAFDAEEMAQVNNCSLFEVLNTHPSVNNDGAEGKASTEEMWDQVLSSGKILYGIGDDDMHKLATYPGKSWVMVLSENLTEQAVLRALAGGRFYVSSGIEIEDIRASSSRIKIRIKISEGEKYTTQFIGRDGRILKTDTSSKPNYKIRGDELYVRTKIINAKGQVALTQPVFIGN
ncbi:CehA/McbA family metallohydrolase [Acidobacteriota bacterium]